MAEVSLFNDVEAAKLAATAERNGHTFYTEAARFCESRQAVHALKMLADQEEAHRSRFDALAASLAARRAESWNNPAAEGYIRALVQTSIFPNVDAARALGRALETEEEAFRLALKVEKDSVLFYTAAAQSARSREAGTTFAQIAEEEKKHLVSVQSLLAKARKT